MVAEDAGFLVCLGPRADLPIVRFVRFVFRANARTRLGFIRLGFRGQPKTSRFRFIRFGLRADTRHSVKYIFRFIYDQLGGAAWLNSPVPYWDP